MKMALVTGAGGFIGSHLVRRLKSEGYWVRGVDLKHPEWTPSPANEFITADLRDPVQCARAFDMNGDRLDEVYQLAADMGGMGFIESHEADIVRNNILINANVLHQAVQTRYVQRYFFASSACVYPDMRAGERPCPEEYVYPALPHNEYGWEKLYSERMALCYARHEWPNAPEFQVRIARFGNTYGPEGTWYGGREKAPAAICRKVAEASDGGEIEVWGDGTAIRSYLYIDDLIDGIRMLTNSDYPEPINIGSDECITVDELVHAVERVADKEVTICHVDGPVGVQARILSHEPIQALGWTAQNDLEAGLSKLYEWVSGQVDKTVTTC